MSLALEKIQHRFGDTLAVDGASLRADPGEIVCLFGPSGCGKTTLLRLAAGLERLQSGVIDLDGVRVSGPETHVSPENRAIGFVFQDYVLFPHLTVEENVAFGVNQLARRERRDRVTAELSAVDLTGFAARYPHELSGGQQQRVALARAFARRPRAMLLDEPFASIDAVRRRRLRDDVRAILKSHETAAILVTHDPDEALAIGDRIAVMHEGRIIEATSPEELFQRPQTPQGAAIFPGAQTIRAEARDGRLYTAFGDLKADVLAGESAIVVIRDGGVAARKSPTGPARVTDLRFVGPNWRVRLRGASDGDILFADAVEPIEPGENVTVDFDRAHVHVFAAS